jgi:hypothetical protein
MLFYNKGYESVLLNSVDVKITQSNSRLDMAKIILGFAAILMAGFSMAKDDFWPPLQVK